EGEEEADGVSQAGRRERLRPEDRLRKKAEFDSAYATGHRIPSTSFTLIAVPAKEGRPRLGVTTSRAVGNAVVRNRVRRRLREVFRRNRHAIAPPLDIVVHVRPGAGEIAYSSLELELENALRRYGKRRRREP